MLKANVYVVMLKKLLQPIMNADTLKVKKNGGEISIENLRPICSNCNKSIGSKDMDDFMTKYKIKKPKNWNGIVEKN